ncbi:MAG: hypothetical protein WCW44_05445 [archaeon]|jgi:hypothetical protein
MANKGNLDSLRDLIEFEDALGGRLAEIKLFMIGILLGIFGNILASLLWEIASGNSINFLQVGLCLISLLCAIPILFVFLKEYSSLKKYYALVKKSSTLDKAKNRYKLLKLEEKSLEETM